MTELTPVHFFGGRGFWAKRDDLAGTVRGIGGSSSGSKMRQYLAMAAKAPGAPMLVGCSANSAMQIYIADAAAAAGVQGIIYTAARKVRTAATAYAVARGCEVVELRPGYLSQVRAAARARAGTLPAVVRWDSAAAVLDAAAQCENLPPECKRVVVPTGSGLTAIGVLAGMADRGMRAKVVLVMVSDMAKPATILVMAGRHSLRSLPPVEWVRAPGGYDDPVAGRLPDGTLLDPFYAAKALPYVKRGDCLWIPGCRAAGAMPAEVVKAIATGD